MLKLASQTLEPLASRVRLHQTPAAHRRRGASPSRQSSGKEVPARNPPLAPLNYSKSKARRLCRVPPRGGEFLRTPTTKHSDGDGEPKSSAVDAGHRQQMVSGTTGYARESGKNGSGIRPAARPMVRGTVCLPNRPLPTSTALRPSAGSSEAPGRNRTGRSSPRTRDVRLHRRYRGSSFRAGRVVPRP